jgi:hypothetical protein
MPRTALAEPSASTMTIRTILASGGVHVRVGPGSCYIEADTLFSSPGDRELRRFIERVFRLIDVTTVDVDREHVTIGIHFDSAGINPHDMLKNIANTLQPESDPVPQSVLQLFLDRVPGRLGRVERRLEAGQELYTVAAEGDGFVVRSQQSVGQLSFTRNDQIQAAEPSRLIATSGESSPRADRALVVSQTTVVEYEPLAETDPADALDHDYEPSDIARLDMAAWLEQYEVRPLRIFTVLGRDVLRFGRQATSGAILPLRSLATSLRLLPENSTPYLSRRGISKAIRPAFGSSLLSDPDQLQKRRTLLFRPLRPSERLRLVLGTFVLVGVSVIVVGPTLTTVLVLGVIGTAGALQVLRTPALQDLRDQRLVATMA